MTPAVFEDPSLPHQIVLTVNTGKNGQIAVSCNCLKARTPRNGGAYKPLETRTRWDAADAIAVWRAHMEAVNAA